MPMGQAMSGRPLFIALLALAATACANVTAYPTPDPAIATTPTESAPTPRERVAAFLESCEKWDEWDKPAPPFQILGNTWYVGTCGISAILVTNPQGHVLIDSGTESGAEIVLANIRRAGFEPNDVRYLLHSHEHFDHVGGFAKIREATGAEILASSVAAEVLRNGLVSEGDPQATSLDPMAPVEVARIVENGEVLKLGDLELTAHATPGHTPGALSWTWTACSNPGEPPVCRRIAYVDSLSPVSAEGYRFSDHPDYVGAFLTSIDRVRALPCDELFTPHPSASGMIENMRTGKIASCTDYAAALTRKLDERLAKEAAQ